MEKLRIGQKISSKIILTNFILILIVSSVLSLSLYWQIQSSQRLSIQERLYDILRFSTPLVDGGFHSLIRQPGDENSPFYQNVFSHLKSIQNTSDIIERIYTLRQLESGQFVYVVVVTEDNKASVGQEYLRDSPLLNKGINFITSAVVEDNIYTDQTGTYLSGYVLIYDQFDDIDGVLGIDINATSVIANEKVARQISLATFLIAVLLSFFLIRFNANKITTPINDLMAGAKRIGEGQYQEEVPVRSQDELATLAIAFNRMTSQLKLTRNSLELEIDKYTHAEKLQGAIYKISQAANSTRSLDDLYKELQEILGELISVENFYIAIYDSSKRMISFPYFVDLHDEQFPPEEIGRNLTSYIIRTGKPLLASPEVFDNLVQQGKIVLAGTKPVDWLGVPLILDNNVIGAMVVQSYSEKVRFNQENVELLEFVSTQIAQAISRKRADEELVNSNERYHRLFENSPISLWEEDFSEVKELLDSLKQEGVTDIKAYLDLHPEVVALCSSKIKILDVNEATLKLFRAKNKKEIINNLDKILDEESLVSFQDELVYIFEGVKEFNWEGVNHRLDGKRLEVDINWSAVPGFEHDFSKVIISMADVTERREFESKLTYMSTHDALTGLYNRAYFDEQLAYFESEGDFPVSIIMADLDNLKMTNDLEGHAYGDSLIKDAAQLLLSSFRDIDIVARIGGDEFAVLLPRTNEAVTNKAIERIKNNIRIKNIDRQDLKLQISFGASTVNKSGSLIKAFEQADKSMYLDKKRKKG